MEKQRIADCFSYVSRGKSPKYTEQSSIKVINQACIYWDRINFEKIKYHDVNYGYSTAIVNEQDLLMNSTGTGTLGRAVVFHAPDDSTYIADSHVTIMRPHHHIDPAYFAYYFSFQKIQDRLFRTCVSGSTNQIELSKEKLLAFQVDVPNLVEQQIVTRKLDKISDLIALRKQQLAKLDELVKARFIEMFGDPVENDMNWQTEVLDSICSTIVDCPHSTPSYTAEDTGYMCIRTSIVKKNRILWDQIEYIPEHEYRQRIQRKKPEKGDIVYTREGAILGIAAMIDRDCNVALGQRSMLLSPDASKCLPQFLSAAMNFDSFLRKALGGISGSASPHINVGDIKAFSIIVPPIELQTQFAAFVEQTDKSKLVIQTALTKLETLKNALMQQYFG